MTTKELNERQARWMQELSQYNFKIEYRPGKKEGKPDALTRREGDLPTAGDKRLTRNVGILLPKERYWDIPEMEKVKLDVLETMEFQDKDEGEIQKASNVDEGRKEMKGIALGLCQCKDGLLWYQGKIWIPKDEGIRTTLIAKHHAPPQAGDGGTAKTTELISRRYYWPKIREDIKRFIKNCDTCQRTKVIRHAPYGLLQSNEAPDRLWKSIAMDVITDLPKSEGSDTILVVIDRLTKMSHFIPCLKDLDARQFAKPLHERDSQATWTTTRYHHRQGDTIHLRPMEGNYGEIRNRTKTQHGIPPTNRRTDRKDECHIGTISTGIHQLPTGRLVWLPTTSRICIQQRISGNHQEPTLFCKLPNKP